MFLKVSSASLRSCESESLLNEAFWPHLGINRGYPSLCRSTFGTFGTFGTKFLKCRSLRLWSKGHQNFKWRVNWDSLWPSEAETASNESFWPHLRKTLIHAVLPHILVDGQNRPRLDEKNGSQCLKHCWRGVAIDRGTLLYENEISSCCLQGKYLADVRSMQQNKEAWAVASSMKSNIGSFFSKQKLTHMFAGICVTLV